MPVAQAERVVSVTTPLGKDVLVLEAFEGQELISGLFHFTLYLISDHSSIPFGAIVGKSATIEIKADGGERYINGFVNEFSQGSKPTGFTQYHATLVPWLWNLTRVADCRIFQNKTVPEIITQIFRDLGYSDFKLMLTGNYQPREYCVQYRETDFDFVSRLMEDEGIFYFFEHSPNKHVMVLGDSPSAHKPCPGQSRAPYNPFGGPQGSDSVSSWSHAKEVRSAKYTINDYNFETPSTDLKVMVPTIIADGRNDRLEIYDYEGKYLKRPQGERYVKLRMEEQEAVHTQISGASDCRAFTPGYLFELTDHYRSDFNGPYLLTLVTHHAASNILSNSGEASYSNSFSCIPKALPFRPPRVSAKPVIRGSHTAVVVGKQGEEIWTDQYGRVKVQFHWDREGKKDENSSCWVRVAQNWAGKRWGTTFIPWIGQEVIVDFLEGDPDQPIIIASVYNAEQMPPYELPDNKTQSGIKSRSSKGGDPTNFNEIRFEDKKGEEQLLIHAEKNQDIEVENDETTHVKHDRTVVVETGNDLHQIKQGNREVQIDMGNDTLTIKMGNQVTKLNLGKSETEAMQSIELKVGQSSIKLDQTGVTIKGMMIMVEGQIQTQVKGLITQVNADAMLQIKGGITMIN